MYTNGTEPKIICRNGRLTGNASTADSCAI